MKYFSAFFFFFIFLVDFQVLLGDTNRRAFGRCLNEYHSYPYYLVDFQILLCDTLEFCLGSGILGFYLRLLCLVTLL